MKSYERKYPVSGFRELIENLKTLSRNWEDLPAQTRKAVINGSASYLQRMLTEEIKDPD